MAFCPVSYSFLLALLDSIPPHLYHIILIIKMKKRKFINTQNLINQRFQNCVSNSQFFDSRIFNWLINLYNLLYFYYTNMTATADVFAGFSICLSEINGLFCAIPNEKSSYFIGETQYLKFSISLVNFDLFRTLFSAKKNSFFFFWELRVRNFWISWKASL